MDEATWRSCVSLDSNKEILGNIDKCSKDLSWWNHNDFGNVHGELKKKNEKKREMQIEKEVVALRSGSNIHIKELKLEINVLLDRQNRMWNQQSHLL